MAKKPQHDEEIHRLFNEGLSQKRIAKTLGIDKNTVRASFKRLGIDYVPHVLIITDEYITEMVEERQPDWEYIGNYTGSDGQMDLRHKACGNIYTHSSSSVRHRRHLYCKHCRDIERKKDRKRYQRSEAAKERAQKKQAAKSCLKRIAKHQEYNQTTAKECPACGALFYGPNKYCSAECSRGATNHRQNNKKRRRAKAAWTDESITISLNKLYKRDNGVCWICGKACDIDADSNSNWYPSIDHVVPIAAGGKDEWTNIRLAHRWCNSKKGAYTVFEEPAGIDLSPAS